MNTRLQMLRLMGCKFRVNKEQRRTELPHGTYKLEDQVEVLILGPSGLRLRAWTSTYTEYSILYGDPVGETHENDGGDFDSNRSIVEATTEAVADGDITEDELFDAETQDKDPNDTPEWTAEELIKRIGDQNNTPVFFALGWVHKAVTVSKADALSFLGQYPSATKFRASITCGSFCIHGFATTTKETNGPTNDDQPR